MKISEEGIETNRGKIDYAEVLKNVFQINPKNLKAFKTCTGGAYLIVMTEDGVGKVMVDNLGNKARLIFTLDETQKICYLHDDGTIKSS
ncbi:hypothetical protein HS7_10940 [Sulfolobales archaeon HS-7]|nr:hypothetical protein HS7_10940 [Sulfolobales archaeon HS-7]